MYKNILFVVLVFSLLLLVGCGNDSSSGASENFPEDDITLIVHTSAGGPTDLMAREVAEGMEEELDVNVLVENQSGGSGATAMNEVATAEADGYTLGTMTPSQLGLIEGNLSDQYNIDDFTWVSRSQIDPYVLVTNSESGIETIEEMVEQLENGSLNVGGYGAQGSAHNISWNIFAEAAEVSAEWTPYESTGDAVTALLGGHIDIANSNPGEVSQYVESGDLQVLAVNAEERLDEFPDVPTMDELGYDVDTDWVQFRGIFAPEGVPEEVLEVYDEVLTDVYNSDSYQEYLENNQMVDEPMTNEEYTEYVEGQSELTEYWYNELGIE